VVDPAVIWNYSTRTLTGFTGQPRIDLLGSDQDLAAIGYTSARAANLDYLDVPVSTRSTLTAAEVWEYTTRTLTGLTGQPRIDLLGEDADFESGTGARKQLIDRLAYMDAFDTPIEGTHDTAYSEETVIQDELSGNPPRFLEGYIDLSSLTTGDTIIVRQYIKITPAGSYIKYAEETYSGPQDLPLLYIVTKPCRYGIRITVTQTAGTSKELVFQFFRRRTT
jgi:hypothetical protein